MEKLKSCPFCGGKVKKRSGFGGIILFECLDKKACGAMISFDSDICNAHPEKADESWNMRKQIDEAIEMLEDYKDNCDFIIDKECILNVIEELRGRY